MTTYTNGFHLTFTADVTKSEFVYICDDISTLHEDYYAVPEAIPEGGIQLMNDNCLNGKYKSMSFQFDNPFFKWPRIYSTNVMDMWFDSEDVIIQSGLQADTFLKAFFGAPVWDMSELDSIAATFAEFGIECTV